MTTSSIELFILVVLQVVASSSVLSRHVSLRVELKVWMPQKHSSAYISDQILVRLKFWRIMRCKLQLKLMVLFGLLLQQLKVWSIEGA